MSTDQVIEAAAAWYEKGVSVLPADASKKLPRVPDEQNKWARYQFEYMDPMTLFTEIERWNAIGCVCGAISGNLEMLELESTAVEMGLYEEFLEALPEELQDKLMTYMEMSPSGGIHWLYRVDGPVKGNTPLAREPRPTPEDPHKIQVLIETRGEGGWTMLAPSVGPKGAWSVSCGEAGEIPKMTANEYVLIHTVASTFDKMPAPVLVDHRPVREREDGEVTPGDDYNNRRTWKDLLERYGWNYHSSEGEIDYWTRPGKTIREGKSASTNYGGSDLFYNFSSDVNIEIGRSYDRFGFYALMEHNGDLSAAASALRKEGYGSTRPVERKLTMIPGEGLGSKAFGPDSGPIGVAGGPLAEARNFPSEIQLSTTLTDDGNALLLVALGLPTLRYNPERGAWLTWKGNHWHWEPNRAGAVELMRDIVRAIVPKDRAEASHKVKSLSYNSIDHAVRLASTDLSIQVTIDELDSDPWALNTPEGVIDLKTGLITPVDPSQLHTRLTGVSMDTTLPAPRWSRFLAETFGNNPELIEYVQRMVGYSAVGTVTHQILPFCHGSGANGKTVFMEVAQRVLGDYAGTSPPDFLLAGGKDETYAEAALAGQRLVVCSEIPPTAKFAESKVKLLTGGDSITARFMRQNYFTFKPSHHLWLLGNHEPRVDAGGDSFWRRLKKVPFVYTVPEEKRIEDLAERMVAEEGPAILAWIVEGARKQINGLAEPEMVKVATAEYAAEEDTLGRFVAERLIIGGDPKVVRLETKIVYQAYADWCHHEGIKQPLTAAYFGRELKNRFSIEKRPSNGRNYYTSVTLATPENDPEDDHDQRRFRY